MKLQQTTLDQTGVAILIMNDDSEKIIPLFSTSPVEEAQALVKRYFDKSCQSIHAVYMTNNLMEVKIEDIIKDYKEKYNYLTLPENYMEELLSGFPYIIGNRIGDTTYFYA